MDDSELNALIKLLSDPDKFVFESAKQKLIDEFEFIQKKFSEAIAESEDDILVQKGNEIITEYHFINAIKELKKWNNSKSKDLIKGIVIISKIFAPELEYHDIFNFFENIRRKLNFDLKNLSPIEHIRLINSILFKENKFKVLQKVSKFEHFLLNKSLDKASFSPIIIAIVYYLIAKRLDIPLSIVRNKNVILLSYLSKIEDTEIDINKYDQTTKHNHYFFINPADKGYIFNLEDLKFSLKKRKIIFAGELIYTDHSDILKLLIGKMIMIAKNKELIDIMDHLVMLHRTLQ